MVDEENKRVMCWKKGFGDLTTFIIVVKLRPVLVVNMVHFTLGQRLHYFGELLNKVSCLLTDCKITSGYHSIVISTNKTTVLLRSILESEKEITKHHRAL